MNPADIVVGAAVGAVAAVLVVTIRWTVIRITGRARVHRPPTQQAHRDTRET
jgi:hypothetical protein